MSTWYIILKFFSYHSEKHFENFKHCQHMSNNSRYFLIAHSSCFITIITSLEKMFLQSNNFLKKNRWLLKFLMLCSHELIFFFSSKSPNVISTVTQLLKGTTFTTKEVEIIFFLKSVSAFPREDITELTIMLTGAKRRKISKLIREKLFIFKFFISKKSARHRHLQRNERSIFIIFICTSFVWIFYSYPFVILLYQKLFYQEFTFGFYYLGKNYTPNELDI